MEQKHLDTLEFPKILARLAEYASFSAGREKALALTPALDLPEIKRRLDTTSEARALLDAEPDTTIGGAHDVRPMVEATLRGVTLPPPELLDIRDTVTAAHNLRRKLTRLREPYPHVADIARRIERCPDVIAQVDRCIDQRANVRDDASADLTRIRREMGLSQDRLQHKLQTIISSSQNAKYLQEALITQREGRYVIPLKAAFKGRIQGIVHDVSASGATLFIEPLSVVDLNNAWRELQMAEQQEVQRILAELSALVADHAESIQRTIEALADLDLVFAQAEYAHAIDAACPHVVPIKERPTVRLMGARHPLLDPKTVVPIDVVVDEETHVVVITGPNTGGKTVSLKTVGLLTVMAQAGLHLPAEEGSTLSAFKAVYADIGDEQSIEQSLSTFSSHLTNILSFFSRADGDSLVLLDELGAGTDPAEGAALARALLDHFRERGAMTFVATHYPELKTYAQLTPGVRNASVEFDTQTLSPTYRLSIGLPGRSNAFAIAQRLGMPGHIVEAARDMVSPDALHTEDMLADIHCLRIQQAQARDAAYEERAEADQVKRDLRQRLDSIDEERQQVLAQAREEAAAELEALQAEIRAARQRLRAAAAPVDGVSAIERDTEVLAKSVDAALSEPEELPLVPVEEDARSLRPGDLVRVRPLDAKGSVIAMDRDEVEVQVGPARTRVDRADLTLITAAPEREQSQTQDSYRVSAADSPGEEIDLRGLTVEEALPKVDRYLDTAFRANLPWVRIIHGKGTGALRRAVRGTLVDHPLVVAHEAGGPREGGDGVTIAKFRLDQT